MLHGGGEPYILDHVLNSTSFLGWIVTINTQILHNLSRVSYDANPRQALTTAGEELDYLDHDLSDLSTR